MKKINTKKRLDLDGTFFGGSTVTVTSLYKFFTKNTIRWRACAHAYL